MAQQTVDLKQFSAKLRLDPSDQGGPSRMDMIRERQQAADLIDSLAAQLAALKERERRCPSMQEAESRALLRGLQECGELLGLGTNASPADVVEAVRNSVQRQQGATA